nr:probable E3 ubiquitin-protein ligase HIP1 [Ipomoea batatas]
MIDFFANDISRNSAVHSPSDGGGSSSNPVGLANATGGFFRFETGPPPQRDFLRIGDGDRQPVAPPRFHRHHNFDADNLRAQVATFLMQILATLQQALGGNVEFLSVVDALAEMEGGYYWSIPMATMGGTMVVEQPEVAALPPPSPPHSHPHQPAVPPPPQNATMEGYANNPLVDAGNLQRQVENGLREATGGNIDPDMVDAVIQLIVDTLESLEDNADHDDILNVHLSIQLEEVMEDSLDEQEDHPGLSDEVIMSLLGTSTFETSSDEDKDSCCICLDEFSTGDELGKINCEHKFHFMCIREWLKRNNICPICRAVALSVS